MAIKEVVKMGHPVLARPAAQVTEFGTAVLADLITDLKDTMVAAGGIGIAAPQIGVPLQVMIYFVPAVRNAGNAIELTTVINPQIVPTTDEVTEDWEACLSVPGLTGQVPRWAEIEMTWHGPDGESHHAHLCGYHARVVQHEADHLQGMLYPRRMADLGTLSYIDAIREDPVQKAG